MSSISVPTRRSALLLAAGAAICATTGSRAAEEQIITVYKDPSCDCCSGWVQHLQHAGFTVKTIETSDLKPVKTRLGVPNDLAACHTAQIGGYVIEGHVPAVALKRFLNDKPSAIGLAVPGMPVGSAGMEGGTAEPYDVMMFGPAGPRTYMRFLGERDRRRRPFCIDSVFFKGRNLAA
jgi:hypothetical protein